MDICPKSYSKFVDSEKCLDLIRDVQTKLDFTESKDEIRKRSDCENYVEKFQKLIDPYQEQPELLDPYLSSFIEELTIGLKDESISSVRYHAIFKFLYHLIKVTGFKAIGKKFPHETDKLPLLIDLLSKEDFADKYDWQTRFVLTVWLSIVLLIPFDIDKFDPASKNDNQEVPLKDKIYSTLYKGLLQHDSCQHVTSYCLAKFFSRSDILARDVETTDKNNLVDKFVNESINELANIKLGIGTSSMEDVKLIGLLRTLSYMYKFLPRHEMKLRSEKILNVLTKLDVDKINRELINHIIIKLIQRAGLALLPVPLASWRYKRGSRILGKVSKTTTTTTTTTTITNNDDDKSASLSTSFANIPSPDSYIEEVDSAEYLESILSVLFVACQNSQTRIRWSAAKGIARLSSRLSRERASDVIDMILSNFFDQTTSNEFSWHGGCLTLAEMSRNGLILEEKLEQVMTIIKDAIVYDKIKGSFAVGSHVREAACYVCWAIARSYSEHLLEPYIPLISINLICTMLFDRELQCRRAASATFQELVGRQGTFNEEGINILNNVDYQNVGQRQLTYLVLAERVVGYSPDKYARPFVEHLLKKKIGHWDIQIRRVACDSLATLMVHMDFDSIESNVIVPLMQMIDQNLDNNMKHGAIIGLAKVISKVAGQMKLAMSLECKEKLRVFMGSIVNLCEKQLKSKQQAPNFIEAIGFVIASCEAAEFDYPDKEDNFEDEEIEEEKAKSSEVTGLKNKNKDKSCVSVIKQWESVALSALDSDNSQLRDIGADALLTLYKTYHKSNKGCQDRLLTILNKSLNSLNESSRCGSLKALSKLSQVPDSYFETQPIEMVANRTTTTTITNTMPILTTSYLKAAKVAGGSKIRLDSDTPNIILMSITGYIAKETHEQNDNIVFAQAKAEACEALVNFVCSLDKVRILPLLNLIRAAYDALLEKTEDYTLDKRGDIGVVVRQAAVKALLALTIYFQSINLTSIMFEESSTSSLSSSLPISSGLIQRIITKFLQQSVSYHNSARELASSSVYNLITLPSIPDKLIPHRAYILSLFEKFGANKEDFNWRQDSIPIFVSLLTKEEYNLDLWIGLVPAIGQASEISSEPFRNALTNFIRELSDFGESKDSNKKGNLEELFNAFLACLSRSGTLGERLLTSGLITADFLLSQGLMNESSSEFHEKLADFCWKARLKGPNSGSNLTSKPDPKRLVSVARVLCSMLQLSGQVQVTCLKYCLQLLVNGFSRVRVSTAEQLYLSLMTYEDELKTNLTSDKVFFMSTSSSSVVGGEEQGREEEVEVKEGDGKKEVDLKKAMDLLSETDWSEALENVKPIRDQINVCFGGLL